MAITKLGQEFIKESGGGAILGRGIWGGAKLLGRGVAGVGRGIYGAGRLAGKAGIGAASWWGRKMIDKPGRYLPLTAAGGLAAYNLPQNFKKNMWHTDPNNNQTYRGFKEIKYHNPEQMQHINNHTSFLY